MLEKVKAVNNPLTIIAIFAGLAEIVGTVALAAVDKSLQVTFVWFVMSFPILLVLLFFATLNFNPKVLYAPSDFRNEENFLSAVVGTRNLSMSIDQMTQQLENAKQQILQQTLEEITTVGDQERNKLTQIVNMQLRGLELRLESVRREAESVASNASNIAFPQSNLQANILQYLSTAPEPQTIEQIATHLNMSLPATTRALQRLRERSLVIKQTLGTNSVFYVTGIGIDIEANA